MDVSFTVTFRNFLSDDISDGDCDEHDGDGNDNDVNGDDGNGINDDDDVKKENGFRYNYDG